MHPLRPVRAGGGAGAGRRPVVSGARARRAPPTGSGRAQESRIGDQTGGRVFLFLHTDDFSRDYRAMKAKGVESREEPREEAYGTVAVFLDLYGNRWDLVEARARYSPEP